MGKSKLFTIAITFTLLTAMVFGCAGPSPTSTPTSTPTPTEMSFLTLPSDILAPVVGPLEVIGPTGTPSNNKWCFNQHQSSPDGVTGHILEGGIGQADDTYAWDVNLSPGDTDAGKPVYAVAEGVISQAYGSRTNVDGLYGQVLIEHSYQGNK